MNDNATTTLLSTDMVGSTQPGDEVAAPGRCGDSLARGEGWHGLPTAVSPAEAVTCDAEGTGDHADRLVGAATSALHGRGLPWVTGPQLGR
jgi:hypothetical protein